MKLKTTVTPSKLLATYARPQKVPGICQHLLRPPTSELKNPLAADQASMQVHRLYQKPPRYSSRLRGSQTPQDTLGLIRPPSADLTSDDDQESPAISTAQLWIRPHLVLPGRTQSRAMCVPLSASWHPPNYVSPSATTSKRRPSEFRGGEMSKSLSITLVDTPAPPSRQI